MSKGRKMLRELIDSARSMTPEEYDELFAAAMVAKPTPPPDDILYEHRDRMDRAEQMISPLGTIHEKSLDCRGVGCKPYVPDTPKPDETEKGKYPHGYLCDYDDMQQCKAREYIDRLKAELAKAREELKDYKGQVARSLADAAKENPHNSLGDLARYVAKHLRNFSQYLDIDALQPDPPERK